MIKFGLDGLDELNVELAGDGIGFAGGGLEGVVEADNQVIDCGAEVDADRGALAG